MLRIINATHNLAYIEFGSFWGPSPPGPRVKPARWMPRAVVHGTSEYGHGVPCRAAVYPYPNGSAYTDAHLCQKDCDEDAACNAWLMHLNPQHHPKAPGWRCCKFKSWDYVTPNGPNTTTSGIKAPPNASTKLKPRPPVPHFFEMYDYKDGKDPEALSNLYNSAAPEVKAALHDQLVEYFVCQGVSCP